MIFENERSTKFYIIQTGEFRLTKKVLKPINKDDPDVQFLQTELKRMKFLNRNDPNDSQQKVL